MPEPVTGQVEKKRRRHRTDILTGQQERFVSAYARTGSIPEAMSRAGYLTRRSRLLRIPAVAAKLRVIQERINAQKASELPKQELLREVSSLAFSNITRCLDDDGRFLPAAEIPIDIQPAIQVYKQNRFGTTVVFHDKLKAIELGMRHHGMLQETPNTGLTVQVVVGKLDPGQLDPVLRAKVVQSESITPDANPQVIDTTALSDSVSDNAR